jgi:hypothetical protein
VEFHDCMSALSPEQAAPLWQAAQGASGSLFSARGLNVRFWGYTEPPFAFYSESFFGTRREGDEFFAA